MDELLERLKHLPPRTAVMFSPLFYTDASGRYFIPEKSLELMSRASNAPIYGTNDHHLGLGVVGGALYDMEMVGVAGGRVARRILAGAPPASVSVETISPNRNAFDARQLQRWNISEARLPPGSVVMYRERSIWSLYQLYILGCVAIFLLLLAFIATLAAQTRKLQHSESLLRDLSGRLIHAQDEERKRIARELHDDFGQRISLLKIELELLAQEERPIARLGSVPRLRDVISITDEFAADLQHLSHTLHSSRLQYIGLQSALNELCSDVAHRQDVVVELRAEPLAAPVQPEVALCMYRIAQEGLHNAAKHSGAGQIVVALSDDKHDVRMRITDNGKGFDVTKAFGGLGLPSMRARLRMLGGELLVRSAPGRGTELIARVPVHALTVPVHGELADARSA
jgi:signal transduction histidine kinase